MAIQMKVEGLKELSEMLSQMGEESGKIAAGGLYEGAGVMADEIKKGAEGIKTSPIHYAVFVTRDPSPEEKAAVLEAGVGIAKFNKNGSEVDTSVGYRNAGYATLAGRRKPIPKIVNAINSGTSLDISPIDDLNISVIFFGQAGQEGGRALADVLSGKCNISDYGG